tara:strand:+ start:108 stop:329 length:222 start_codon:yes stop_codon:yes gene_type:complete
MGKNDTPTMTMNDKEYDISGMSDQQKVLLSHVTDLDRKIKSVSFNLDQLRIGRETFVNMLSNALEAPAEADAA